MCVEKLTRPFVSDPDQVHKSDAGGSFQQPLACLRTYCATSGDQKVPKTKSNYCNAIPGLIKATSGDCHPNPIKVAAVPGSRFYTRPTWHLSSILPLVSDIRQAFWVPQWGHKSFIDDSLGRF